MHFHDKDSWRAIILGPVLIYIAIEDSRVYDVSWILIP